MTTIELPNPVLPQPIIDPRKAFDRVIIINLKRRTDRLDQIKKQFDKGWPFEAMPTVMQAVDGQKIQAPEGYKEGRNVWACLQSHRMAIQDSINNDFDSVLVLEDDAIFCEGFAEKALRFMTDLPQDWEFAFLGGHHFNSSPYFVKPGIVRPVHMDRMHAYAARGTGLLALYEFWHRWHDGHCDHAISKWICEKKTYCCQPFIVGQSGGPSDVQRFHGNGPQTLKGEEWWIAADDLVLNDPGKPEIIRPPVNVPVKRFIPVVNQPPQGVGTEVSTILKSIGIQTDGCGGCMDMVKKMNDWGTQGCEEHRDEILQRLRQKSGEVNWLTKINLAKNAVLTGLAAEVNWLDPAPGILDKAIGIIRERENRPILSLCLPTRGRLELLKRALNSFFDTTRGHRVECIVASHPDESVDMLLKMEADQETNRGLKVLVVDEMLNAIQATNIAAKESIGKFLMIGHDDFEFTPKWLDKALESWNSLGKPDKVYLGLWGDDSRVLSEPPTLFTRAMGTRQFFVEECGGVLAIPSYGIWWNDNEIYERANRVNCSHFCPESVIIHHQASRGKRDMDETAKLSSLKHASDEEMFRRRSIAGFPNDFEVVITLDRKSK